MNKDRAIKVFNELLKELGMNPKQLSDSLGKDRPQWAYDILNKDKNVGISKKIAESICENFPQINKSWLLTGEGDMLNKEKENVDIPLEAAFIPLLPVSAQGGSLNDFVVSVRESDCEKVVSPVKGADFAMYIAGDSMAPEYPNGSQVHVKKIDADAFIEWGKVYVLDTCNGAVVKRIIPSDREGFIKCVSINPNPIYAPFEVNMNDVYGIYRVMLCLSIK